MRIRDVLSRHGPPEVDDDPWLRAPRAEGGAKKMKVWMGFVGFC